MKKPISLNALVRKIPKAPTPTHTPAKDISITGAAVDAALKRMGRRKRTR
jgi:hypothetical protein